MSALDATSGREAAASEEEPRRAILATSAGVGHAKGSGADFQIRHFATGAVLQCVEAATLGMPFEVWKTRMGSYRSETTMQAFRALYARGIPTFWAGTSAKMVESATKGAILMASKESIASFMLSVGVGETLTGFVAGAGGGICQTVVMGPCTFLVTAAVNADPNVSTMQRVRTTLATQGIRGFYPGGTAIAMRQATNWASRQGFTELVRGQFKVMFHGDENARLTVPQEALAGIVGGALATWNQPFEVARIQMQSAAARGEPKQSMPQVFRMILKEQGVPGLFTGIIPRIGLGIWQTLFMVTGAKLLRRMLEE